jgi:hypothetical protein
MLSRCAVRGHDIVVWPIGLPSIRLGVLGGLGGAHCRPAILRARHGSGTRASRSPVS